jgi:hypothetical protein
VLRGSISTKLATDLITVQELKPYYSIVYDIKKYNDLKKVSTNIK